MKPRTLSVKRRPVPKGMFKRLSAVTGNRKQRVAAAASADMDLDDSSSKISRALTIIFLIHIVAIGLIFVHQKFLDGRTSDEPKSAKVAKPEAAAAAAAAPTRSDLPRLSSGEQPYIVRQGDNYARIAVAMAVEEKELRLINRDTDIVPGLLLKIPPKRIVAVEPAEVVAIRSQAPSDAGGGLVEAVDVSAAPRAQLVRPAVVRSPQAAVAAPASAAEKSYIVQNGDTVWGVANRFKVNQGALMKANGITDARKVKAGMTLMIPH